MQILSESWPSFWPCKRHESSCEGKDKFIYPGVFHTPAKNMFNILNHLDVSTQQRTYPWFIVYDFESIQPPADTQTAGKIERQREHHPISVSMCSNFPQFQDPKCFVKSRKENPQKLTQLSSRSHLRHLVGKRTAQKDTIIDITSDSQVKSNFPNRWSPASLTFNNYFYLFLYLYIT